MRSSAGFTLIELLLATVLTSLLMLGVLGVIARVSTPAGAAVDAQIRAEDSGMLNCVRLLRTDLSIARTLETNDGAIELVSHGGLDPATYERSQLPVAVSYFVETVGGRPWLLREERLLAGPDTQSLRVEAVRAGITRIELLPLVAHDAEGPATAHQSATELDALQRPADTRWLLRLWENDTQVPAIEKRLVLPRRLAG